jgi:hypothetical protein
VSVLPIDLFVCMPACLFVLMLVCAPSVSVGERLLYLVVVMGVAVVTIAIVSVVL